jgi:hypothetical protein
LIKVPTRVGWRLLEQPLDLNLHLPSLLHWRGSCATGRRLTGTFSAVLPRVVCLAHPCASS